MLVLRKKRKIKCFKRKDSAESRGELSGNVLVIWREKRPAFSREHKNSKTDQNWRLFRIS